MQISRNTLAESNNLNRACSGNGGRRHQQKDWLLVCCWRFTFVLAAAVALAALSKDTFRTLLPEASVPLMLYYEDDWGSNSTDYKSDIDLPVTTDSSATYFPTIIGKDWNSLDPNRSIAFVHVGKAGGLTLRETTSLICRLGSSRNRTDAEQQSCVDQKFNHQEVLARQVHYYFHMATKIKPEEMERATSFLFVLRHPVDRLISSFRYSHPENCNDKSTKVRGSPDPDGCRTLKRVQTRGTPEFQVYHNCFPSAAMEVFAQSIMSPFPLDSTWPFHNSSGTDNKNQSNIVDHSVFNNSVTETNATSTPATEASSKVGFHLSTICRTLANRMVRGVGPVRANPHMHFNYDWYLTKTIRAYPEKEVFGIRTEHEWDDIKALDVALGGVGEFRRGGTAVSHGSEHYKLSSLTTQAYHKLCCVLHDEITQYLEVLQKVVNLNETAKEDAMGGVFRKCDITTSLDTWRQTCREHLARDKPHFAQLKSRPQGLPKNYSDKQSFDETSRYD